jgi:hypothetical protein
MTIGRLEGSGGLTLTLSAERRGHSCSADSAVTRDPPARRAHGRRLTLNGSLSACGEGWGEAVRFTAIPAPQRRFTPGR